MKLTLSICFEREENMKKYVNILIKKTKKYDKYAKNPFLDKDFEYNPFKSIYEQTYIWVDKPK